MFTPTEKERPAERRPRSMPCDSMLLPIAQSGLLPR